MHPIARALVSILILNGLCRTAVAQNAPSLLGVHEHQQAASAGLRPPTKSVQSAWGGVILKVNVQRTAPGDRAVVELRVEHEPQRVQEIESVRYQIWYPGGQGGMWTTVTTHTAHDGANSFRARVELPPEVDPSGRLREYTVTAYFRYQAAGSGTQSRLSRAVFGAYDAKRLARVHAAIPLEDMVVWN